MKRLALLAALALAPAPLAAQTVTKVQLPDIGLTLEQGRAFYLQIIARLRCDVYAGTAITNLGCSWTSRNTALATVIANGRWTQIAPKRTNGETWVIAANSGKKDSVKIKVVYQ